MLIWIIKIGETLPISKQSQRLLRSGTLSKMLSNLGHKVVWWTSTFDHFNKKHFFNHDKSLKVNLNLKLELIKGTGYKKNVSFTRLYDHNLIAKKFKERIYKEKKKPDVILCSYPTSELAYQCILYGKKFKIPVVLDIRDLWPDIYFKELLPKFLSKIFLNTYNLFYRRHIYVLKNASGLVGITDRILGWGLNYAKRKKRSKDKVFYLSYEKPKNLSLSSIKIESFKKKFQLKKNVMYVCLIGTISKYKFNLVPIIDAAKYLMKNNINVEFLICGKGERLRWLRKKSIDLNNINILGWLNAEEIYYILNNSHIGIAPYNNTFTYKTSIPSKISEYLAYGLPIVSSLNGELRNFIKSNNVGYTYNNGFELFKILQNIVIDNNLRFFKKNNKALFNKKFDTRIVYNEYVRYICSFQKKKF